MRGGYLSEKTPQWSRVGSVHTPSAPWRRGKKTRIWFCHHPAKYLSSRSFTCKSIFVITTPRLQASAYNYQSRTAGMVKRQAAGAHGRLVLCTDFWLQPHISCCFVVEGPSQCGAVSWWSCPARRCCCCCCCRDVWTITLLSSGGGLHSAHALLTHANITLLSHLLNYVSRIDAFLAT